MSGPGHVAAVLTAALVVLVSPGAAWAAPGAHRGGEVVKTGWWWAANDPPPTSGLAAPPQPSPPNVPAGALPVSAAGGDPEKISAIEFALDTRPGSLVTSSELVLRETRSPGASVNQDTASVLACPVVEPFWADGAAASWKSRPEYDCGLAQAAGERDPDGVWHFDLTSIATLWLSRGYTSSRSVALVEDTEAPGSFQVTYDGKGIALTAVTTAPLAGQGSGLAASGPPKVSGGRQPVGSGLPTGDMAAFSGGGSGAIAAPLDAPPVAVDAGAVPVTAPADGALTQAAAPTAGPPWYSGVPRLGWLMLPLVLGLAYLMMLALGPDAQPSATTSRHGVSRALDRLRRSQIMEGER